MLLASFGFEQVVAHGAGAEMRKAEHLAVGTKIHPLAFDEEHLLAESGCHAARLNPVTIATTAAMSAPTAVRTGQHLGGDRRLTFVG